MNVFELMKDHNQEQLGFYADKTINLRAILAIHSTTLGPAIGGIRIKEYQSVLEALEDLCRLSRAMTFKVAAAGLNFGGGYAVVVKQEGMQPDEPFFRSMGRFIESFKGRFIAGGEMGVTEESMEYLRMETKYISGLPAYFGGSGNHSEMGAFGASMGILAAAKYKWGSDSLEGKKIVIQGYGRTGQKLAAFAQKGKADVHISEIVPEKIEKAKLDGFNTISAMS